MTDRQSSNGIKLSVDPGEAGRTPRSWMRQMSNSWTTYQWLITYYEIGVTMASRLREF